MIRDIQRKYFEAWGESEAQNSFLKGFLIVLGILFCIQSIALTLVSMKKPVLVAVGKSETQVLTLTPPSDDLLALELRRWAENYLETHYNWSASTVEKSHAEAAKYVSEKFVKAFTAANSEQVKIAKEKKLSQKVYVSDLKVDPKALSARATLDRIIIVEGLRAASSLVLEIGFEYGPRTTMNPAGIYVTSEKVVNPQ